MNHRSSVINGSFFAKFKLFNEEFICLATDKHAVFKIFTRFVNCNFEF